MPVLPAGAVDGRWRSETMSLSTSTRAALTPLTRRSRLPIRSLPTSLRGGKALVAGNNWLRVARKGDVIHETAWHTRLAPLARQVVAKRRPARDHDSA